MKVASSLATMLMNPVSVKDKGLRPGSVVVLIYPFLWRMEIPIYHMAVMIITPVGQLNQLLAFGGDGVGTHEVDVWQGVGLGAAFVVGHAIQGYMLGQAIPVVTSDDLRMSHFRGVDYNYLLLNCDDFAWSLVSFVTGGEYMFIWQTMQVLFQYRSARNSHPLVRNLMDYLTDHLGDDDEDEELNGIVERMEQADMVTEGRAEWAKAYQDYKKKVAKGSIRMPATFKSYAKKTAKTMKASRRPKIPMKSMKAKTMKAIKAVKAKKA